MRRTSHTQKGFTVAEILVATSIFAVIMVAALLIYDRSNKVFKSGVEAADVQQNTRVAYDKIVSDLRMAGFDFDRDGTPSTADSYQQPDEQVEAIHQRAITIRANYDYNDNPTADDHGREFVSNPGLDGLESVNFPVVTTGNDEIVTYALVSEDATKNTGTLTFYADVPDRKAHPEAGGRSENAVNITGIDLTGANPPYTIERISLNTSTSSVTPLTRYPIATNIFDMQFTYYEDQVGTDVLTDLSATVIAPANYGSAVGGQGQFDPTSAASYPARLIRGKIQSIKLVLIGMTQNPDPAYTDPNDATIAPMHRKYRLESLIVPRNYGRRGFREQDYVEPTAPTITKVCIGYCGVAWVEWDQPSTGGAPEDYQVRYDTVKTGSYNDFDAAGLSTSRYIVLPDPSASYFFQVAAVNSYGSATSNIYPTGATGLSAMNNTIPKEAEGVTATGGANQILLEWTAPDDYQTAGSTVSCSPSGSGPPTISVGEYKGFSVLRSRVSGFNPATDPFDIVYDARTESSQALPDPISFTTSWADDSSAGGTLPMGPVNCYTYYYRLKTQENCTLAAENVGGVVAKSRSVGWTTEVTASGNSDVIPSDVGSMSADETLSSCDANTDGYCDVQLRWPKIITDVNGDPISVSDYTIYWEKFDLGGTSMATGSEAITLDTTPCTLPLDATDVQCAAYEADAANMTYVFRADSREDPSTVYDAVANPSVYYEYWVTAKQCASAESNDSPKARYPCTFGATVTGAMTGVIEGDGSNGSPWLIQPTSVFSVDTGATTVASFTATVILPDSSRSLLGTVGAGTTASWPWADLGDGVVFTIEVVVEDITGCKRNFYWYVEETSTNCCLTPVNIEARLLQQDGPGQKTRVRFQNLCSEDLTITDIEIYWDNSKLLGGGPSKMDEVIYPTALGSCPTIPDNINSNASPQNTTPPAGALATIPVDSSSGGVICEFGGNDYEIEITFTKSYDPLDPVVTQVCVSYTRPSDLSATQCQILPNASTVAGVCDIP